MAHSTNRIYIDTSVTPNVGVSIADIQAVIGCSRNDIGGLITTGNINKWAKYKPTRMNGINPADWWKGEVKSIYGSATGGYTFGFSLSEFSSLSALKAAIDAGTIGWEYEKPRGIATQPGEYFRFLDFNGYINNATSPFRSVTDTFMTYIDNEVASLALTFSPSDGSLGMSDFVSILGSWYFGVAIYKGASLIGVGTSSVAIENAESDSNAHVVSMSLPPRALGSCTLYPFFSYQARTWSETNNFSIERFVAIPLGAVAVTVTDGSPLGGLTFTLASGGSINRATAMTNGRLITTFPALSVSNAGPGVKTLVKSNLVYRMHIEKNGDPQTSWDSDYLSLNQTGSVTIQAEGTAQIFSGVSNLVISDTALIAFFQQGGGSISDYLFSAIIYYDLETTYERYFWVTTLDV